MIDSAWQNIPKGPGPLIALYSALIGCILARMLVQTQNANPKNSKVNQQNKKSNKAHK